MSRLSDKVMRRLIWILLALALCFLIQAFYIPAKAMLAQVLLRQAWANTLIGHGRVNKPWPWADTWPVARLIVPAQDIDQIVLASDAGNSLAFGPGLSVHSSRGIDRGAIMISAHRDTQFHFLKDIVVGELIELQDKTGRIRHYQVQHTQVVDTHDGNIQVPDNGKWLVLVTCYPFGSLLTGGSRRYVVSAQAVSNGADSTLLL